MKKKTVIAIIGKLACMVSLAAMLGGCEEKNDPVGTEKPAVTLEPVDSEDAAAANVVESREEPQPENIPEDAAEPAAEPNTEPVTEPVDAGAGEDGYRFEKTIMLEGMEEKVRYEHVKDEIIGFELDYEYESLTRKTDSGSEFFISIYDDPDSPDNYFEITFSTDDAETAAEAVSERLSDEYDVMKGSYKLDNAGDCILLEASTAKGGQIAGHIQSVYIIPASGGCLIAALHCSLEAAGGFGSRFNYMMNTMTVISP